MSTGAVPNFAPSYLHDVNNRNGLNTAAEFVDNLTHLSIPSTTHQHSPLAPFQQIHQNAADYSSYDFGVKQEQVLGRPAEYVKFRLPGVNQIDASVNYQQQYMPQQERPTKRMRTLNEPITRQEDGQSDDEDDDFVDGEDDEEVGQVKDNAKQTDILNSDDDISDTEEQISTSHMVLSQFEKVSRTKDKWKCSLKCGIMHLNGRDYVFNKSTGEFKW